MRILEIFAALVKAVKLSHGRLLSPMLYCHDFDHVLRVALMAYLIAEDEESGRLAFAAGLCHNADRFLQKLAGSGRNGKVDDFAVIVMVNEWLNAEPLGTFSESDRELIVDAVLNHSNRNSPQDGLVLMTLQDADRIVNIELDVIIRKGQYFGDDLRVVDPVHLLDDPDATYQSPGSILWTIKDDIECFGAEEGVASLRLPKAREFAKPLFADARNYLNMVLRQRERAGLIPYPVIN